MKHSAPSVRQQRYNNLLQELAGEFIARETNGNSLITATRVLVSPDLKRATVYFTVFPNNKEEEVLHFLRRKRIDFKHFIKSKKTAVRSLPFVEFEVDLGEKNRQELDKISYKGDVQEDINKEVEEEKKEE